MLRVLKPKGYATEINVQRSKFTTRIYPIITDDRTRYLVMRRSRKALTSMYLSRDQNPCRSPVYFCIIAAAEPGAGASLSDVA